jgi:hypothetical protein
MLEGEELVKELAEDLRKIAIPPSQYTSRRALERSFQCRLFALAFRYNLLPLPEGRIRKKNGYGYVDMIWLNERGEAVVVFEISGVLKRRDVIKMRFFPSSIKIFVNVSPRRDRIRRRVMELKAFWKDLENAFLICPLLPFPLVCRLSDAPSLL